LRKEVEGWFTNWRHLTGYSDRLPADRLRLSRANGLHRQARDWRPFLPFARGAHLQETQRPRFRGSETGRVAVECFHKHRLFTTIVRTKIKRIRPARHCMRATACDRAQMWRDLRLVRATVACIFRPRLISKDDSYRGRRDIVSFSHWSRGRNSKWRNQRTPLTTLEVLDSFRRKTAACFRSGAVASGRSSLALRTMSKAVLRTLQRISGIAYQIRDALDDLATPPTFWRPEPDVALGWLGSAPKAKVVTRLSP